MKKCLFILGCFLSIAAAAQQPYWQQEVAYDINVALNDREHTLKGDLRLEYTNHSPDALNFIWFHLWPNAYRNDKTAYAKQLLRDAEGKKRWKAMEDKGFIDSLNFAVDGRPAKTEAHPDHIDV